MDELFREVEAEKEHILGTLQASKEALGREEKTVVELAAIATFLQNAYNGYLEIAFDAVERLKNYQTKLWGGENYQCYRIF